MIKKDIPQTIYRGDFALSRSDIFEMRKSPMHFRYALDHPREETAAMAFGTALHCYVLEPEKFAERYVICEKIDRRTTAGKAKLAEIDASGLIPMDEETWQKMECMRTNIMSNKDARLLLTGEKEKSYFWTDNLSGIDLKCRPDCRTDIGAVSVIVDLKTTADASTEGFMRSCLTYGYDLQAAMYKQGVESVEGKPHRFVFIAVEKEPPYACNVLEAGELMIRKGNEDLRSYLYAIKHCKETNNWYGYNGESDNVNIVGLPDWLAKDYE